MGYGLVEGRNMYVVMKKQKSPIFLTEAKPHLVCADLKTVQEQVRLLNLKANNNNYWYVKVKYI